MTRDIVELLRPAQWLKNLLVFAALVFSKQREGRFPEEDEILAALRS